MSSIELGGSAFPIHDCGHGTAYQDGMTLRDYFAAKAMQGFAADPEASWTDGAAGMARCAYDWADAMIAARNAA